MSSEAEPSYATGGLIGPGAFPALEHPASFTIPWVTARLLGLEAVLRHKSDRMAEKADKVRAETIDERIGRVIESGGHI